MSYATEQYGVLAKYCADHSCKTCPHRNMTPDAAPFDPCALSIALDALLPYARAEVA